MMTFVNMDSEGLTILPTHRVVFGLKNFDAEKFLTQASDFFHVQPVADPADADALQQQLTQAGRQGTAFIAVTRTGKYLLTARRPAIEAALSTLPERQRQLDVVQLHQIILERLLGITKRAILDQSHLRYLRDMGEVIQQVAQSADQSPAESPANIAFLMNPATLEQLREVAFAGDVMPQKSTDFFPKLLSGVAMYALD